MRAFPVPVQITEEEKLFGGMLSLRQLLYIIAGVCLGGLSFLIIFMPVVIRLFIFLIMSCLGPLIAFIPIYHMRADQFIFRYIKWKCSSNSLYLRGHK